MKKLILFVVLIFSTLSQGFAAEVVTNPGHYVYRDDQVGNWKLDISFDGAVVVFDSHFFNATQFVVMKKVGGTMKIVQAERTIWDNGSWPFADRRPTPILKTNDVLSRSSSGGPAIPTVDDVLGQIDNVDPIVVEAIKAYREQIPNYSQKNEGEYGEWLEEIGTLPEKKFPLSLWERMSNSQRLLTVGVLFGMVCVGFAGGLLIPRRRS
ncbi:MAG: hypothetical protein HGA67_00370 [Candidatus Yonathbacteria bacterium]|nr:hypothetical protein [Candidatus Yonathbacteria bacterium]